MAKSQTQEERQLIKLVGRLPVPAEEKTAWLEQIQHGDMSEELAEIMREKLTAPVEGEDTSSNTRSRYQAELANLVRRWRLSNQAHNFGKR
jgi:predicted transcriptional regulator